MENALREFDQSVTIPYWDFNLDYNMPEGPFQSIMWSDDFAGNGGNPVTSGPFSGWGLVRSIGSTTMDLFASNSDLRTLFSIQSTTFFRSFLESLHNMAHVWVGGDMQNVDTAPRDPVFFMLHSYVDYLWWQWQMNNANNPATWTYPFDPPNSFHDSNANLFNLTLHGRTITNEEGYSRDWAYNYFTYEPAPSCQNGTCTGPYLRCVEGNNEFGGQTSYCASADRSITRSVGQQSRKKRDVVSNSAHAILERPYPNHETKRIRQHFSSIEDYLALDLTKSPLWPGEHPELRAINGFSVQNEMRINCDQDYHLWAFLPIKIIHLRPYGNIFASYPVSNGVMDYKLDIYSDLLYRKYVNFTRPEHPPCVKPCIGDATGTSKVFIRSQGMNYYGKFHDYVIIDDRQPIDAKIGYIGIRRPDQVATRVMITAHDQCGRICEPKCLKIGSNPPKYEPCSGVIKVDRKSPRFYSNNYGDAVLKYWSMVNDVCPSEKQGNVYMIFYCNYKADWFPWLGAYKVKKK